MKQTASLYLYILKISFRNIRKSLFRFLLFVCALSFLVLTIYLSLSTNEFLKMYYNNETSSTYHDYQLNINPTLESNSRFFSITPLLNSSVKDELKHYLQLFEIETTFTLDSDIHSVTLFSTSIASFTDYINPNNTFVLLPNDAIITSSFAKKHDIDLFDTVDIQLGDKKIKYQVAYIINDYGLFKDERVFIDQKSILKTLITTLDPSLSNLPEVIYERFTNQLYLSFYDGVDIEQVKITLETLPGYQNLSISHPFNQQRINQNIQITATFFTIILSIISLTLLVFFYTNLQIISLNRHTQYQNLRTIGFKNKQIYLLFLTEIYISLIIGFVIGFILSYFVIDYGFYFLGSTASYKINLSKAFVVFGIMNLLVFISLGVLLSDKKRETQTSKTAIKIFFVCLIVAILLYTKNVVLIILITVAFLFMFCSLKLPHLFFATRKFKGNILTANLFKMTLMKKTFKAYIVSLFIVFLSVFLLFYANRHMSERIKHYESFYQFDFYITGITQNFTSIEDELSKRTDLEFSPIVFDTNVTINDHVVMEFVSINPDDISIYYDLNISKDALTLFKENQEPTIILPYAFKVLYGLNVLDDVVITTTLGNQTSYNISGFFDKELSNLVISNLNTENKNRNSFMIKSLDDKQVLKTSLLSTFQKRLIVVYDYNSSLSRQLIEMKQIQSYLNLIICFILVSLMLSSANQQTLLYQSLKDNYVKLSVLGLAKDKRRKYLIKESWLIFILTMVFTYGFYLVFLTLISDLYLSFFLYEISYDYRLASLFAFIFITVFYFMIRYFYQKTAIRESFSSHFQNFD